MYETTRTRIACLQVHRTGAHRQPAAEPTPLALARLVTAEVRRHGKHFLPGSLLARLNDARRRNAGRDELLDAFLHCVLDKHDGRFWNRTYLALPVLELLARRAALTPERMAVLLVADIVRYEQAALAEGRDVSDFGRPDELTARKRLRHAQRFVGETLPDPPLGVVADWLPLTAHPVDTVHDEYFFLRVLQAHEMTFTAMVERLHAGVAALRTGSIGWAAESVDGVRELLEQAAGLFRLAATMRPAAFLRFRQYTQGASAVQSEQYKRFELLCGMPRMARLQSPAFGNVPAVRAEAGRDSLTEAYLDTRTPHVDPTVWMPLDRALAGLESAHQRWKTAHHGLAARMLGDAHGSGYTAGVPYLKECLDNRLFWQLTGCPR